jgi:spermidine/putrescine transport system ATP-binding protein
LVRLTDLASRKPAQLSGGQQQRVALARALAKKPLVLLLDEPLAALDLKLRRGMQAELKRLQETTGITFVFVTHDQEEALSMGDRIAVFNSGKPVQIGTPEEIYEQPVNRFVADFIGESNFITAPVSEKGGKQTIQLDGGDVITLPHAVEAVDGKVTIAIRPERILLNGAGPKLATGTITNIVYMGTDLRCTVKLQDGTDVAVRVPPPFGVDLQQVGAQVTLSAAPTSIRPMAPEGK